MGEYGFNRANTSYARNKAWEDAANIGANEFNQAANDIQMGYAGGAVNNGSWFDNLLKGSGGEGLAWGSYLDTGLKGLDVAGKLWQGKTAAEGLKLAKDKFNFEKGLAAANYANQAKSYNEELGRRADVGLALGGNAISPEQRAATLASVASNKVNTTL